MAMGLLAPLWFGLEAVRRSNTESVSVSFSVLIYFTEQAVLLMGQTNNTISYHRRVSILSSLTNPRQGKSLLKNKAAILQSQYVDLFIWERVSSTFSGNSQGEKAIKAGVY